MGSVVPQCQAGDRQKPNLTCVINYTSAVEDLRYVIRGAGLDPSGFSEHSMHRGGATEAAPKGATISEIQFAGDWTNSRTAEKYVEASQQRQCLFNQYLA